MNRNELDGKWFIEYVKKQFETYKVHKQSQHIFMRDNEKIKSILRHPKMDDAQTVTFPTELNQSKTHDAQTVMFSD